MLARRPAAVRTRPTGEPGAYRPARTILRVRTTSPANLALRKQLYVTTIMQLMGGDRPERNRLTSRGYNQDPRAELPFCFGTVEQWLT